MPGTQTLTGPLLYTITMLASMLVAGGFLWLTIKVKKRFPPFTGVMLCFTCLTGSVIPIALLQLLIPRLDSVLDTLTPLLMFAVCGITGVVRLTRARYREETQSVGLLLIVVILALLAILLVLVFPLLGYREAVAFSTAGALTGAIAIIPYWYLRRYVVSRLTQPPLPVSSLAFGRVKRLAVTCALLGLVGLVVQWRAHHLGLLIPSLPSVSALSAWFLIMDAFACWVTIARPLPAYAAVRGTGTIARKS